MPSHEKRSHMSNTLWHLLANKQANKHKICIGKFSSIVWKYIPNYENKLNIKGIEGCFPRPGEIEWGVLHMGFQWILTTSPFNRYYYLHFTDSNTKDC